MTLAPPRHILITGATGAIGSALALAYAAPGRLLVLQGRNAEALQALAQRCQAQGAQVQTRVQDLRQLDDWRSWLRQYSAEVVLDLVVVNAGMNTDIGPDGQGEQWADSLALVQTNLLAAMATVDAVLPSLRARGAGQIALISSLAAYFGLPVTPSYSASKAGLKAYGEALRGWLAAEGVAVNVVMPGYVRSPMCDAMPGPKPFLWPPERAARVIRQALARNRARISFPFPLNWGCWWLAVLPAAWSQRLLRWLGYGG